MKTALFLIPLFFILILLQTSFLVHFSFGGFIFPLVFLVSFGIAFVASPRSSAAVLGAVIGGVFLDAVSSHFFGYWTAVLVFLSLVSTYIIFPYVRFPLLKNQ